MNTINDANYMNNNFAAPIKRSELDEFKTIMGYCDADTVTELSKNFSTIISLLLEQNKNHILTNSKLVKNMQVFLNEQSEKISDNIKTMADSVDLLRKSTEKLAVSSNNKIDKATEEMASGYSGIIRAINYNGSEQRKIMYSNMQSSGDNSKFNNTASKEECTHFLNDLNKAARMIANKRDTNSQEVLNSIYKKIKDSGDDIYASHKLYKYIKNNKYLKLITMCCETDHYRNLVEQYITKELRREFPDRYSLGGMISRKIDASILMGHPKKVTDLVEKYSKKYNLTSRGGAISVYNKLGKRLNKNMKQAAKAYAKSLGYKNCSTCYYIANNDECMDALTKIVAEEN